MIRYSSKEEDGAISASADLMTCGCGLEWFASANNFYPSPILLPNSQLTGEALQHRERPEKAISVLVLWAKFCLICYAYVHTFLWYVCLWSISSQLLEPVTIKFSEDFSALLAVHISKIDIIC